MERSLIIFEDEDLLVVNKPAGMNTHSPSPFAGEGLYEWLKNRGPRWSKLAIIHRLDKETSGVMVFGKTATANRSLTKQFTEHTVRKKYVLWTDRPVNFERRTVVSALVRLGEKYASKAVHAGTEKAETRFRVIETKTRDEEGRAAARPYRGVIKAEPVTGRTHQIRAHAAAEGFPILGDVLYGGTTARRVFLHAAELRLKHPVTSEEMTFSVAADFEGDARVELRERLLSAECGVRSVEWGKKSETSNIEHRSASARAINIELGKTNAYRIVHGAADGWAGWYVERLGEFLLSQSEHALSEAQQVELKRLMEFYGARGAYHKILNRQARRTDTAEASPQLVLGEAVSRTFEILENGARFELSFNEGYSVGLFLDQRDNRRRFLTNHIATDFALFPNGAAGAEVLNTFAYTCGFSVCAALAGARTTSLDLSKKYLEWGKRNFALNGLDPSAHDFIFGDAFDWMKRLAKKGRAFDAIILDPPTFSQSKDSGVFQAEKDYGRLVKAALPLLKPDAVMFASTNAARLEPEKFLEIATGSVESAGRKILQQHYVPQPPDFPVNREEPAYLKTVWLRIG